MAKKSKLLNTSGVIVQAAPVVPGVGADDGDSRALDKGAPAETIAGHEMLDVRCFLMGKPTISMAIFHSFLYVHQRLSIWVCLKMLG